MACLVLYRGLALGLAENGHARGLDVETHTTRLYLDDKSRARSCSLELVYHYLSLLCANAIVDGPIQSRLRKLVISASYFEIREDKDRTVALLHQLHDLLEAACPPRFGEAAKFHEKTPARQDAWADFLQALSCMRKVGHPTRGGLLLIGPFPSSRLTDKAP